MTNNIDKAALKSAIWFLVKFIGVYCFLYFGSLYVISASVKGGHYQSGFVHKWFFYQDFLRNIILKSASFFLNLLGYHPVRESQMVLRMGEKGVRMHNACLGMSVMSFWIAFIVTSTNKAIKKIAWLAIGLFAICFINVWRVCLVLLASVHNWANLHNIDHHLMFNIVAYILIFFLMWLFIKQDKEVVRGQ